MNTQNHSAALEIGWTGFILDSQIDYPSNWGGYLCRVSHNRQH